MASKGRATFQCTSALENFLSLVVIDTGAKFWSYDCVGLKQKGSLTFSPAPAGQSHRRVHRLHSGDVPAAFPERRRRERCRSPAAQWRTVVLTSHYIHTSASHLKLDSADSSIATEDVYCWMLFCHATKTVFPVNLLRQFVGSFVWSQRWCYCVFVFFFDSNCHFNRSDFTVGYCIISVPSIRRLVFKGRSTDSLEAVTFFFFENLIFF